MSQIQYYPSIEEMKGEYKRLKKRKRKIHLSICLTLTFLFSSFCLVFLTTFCFPMYEVLGGGMDPTLKPKDYVLALKTRDVKTSDIVVFQYYGKIMMKRVIAIGGDEIDIKSDGTVWVNKRKISEEYVVAKQLGVTKIKFPYVVPEGKYFVLNDNRSEMLDSRDQEFGCVDNNQIIGKVKYKF